MIVSEQKGLQKLAEYTVRVQKGKTKAQSVGDDPPRSSDDVALVQVIHGPAPRLYAQQWRLWDPAARTWSPWRDAAPKLVET